MLWTFEASRDHTLVGKFAENYLFLTKSLISRTC